MHADSSTDLVTPPEKRSPEAPAGFSFRTFILNKWVVLLLLWCMIGPFALPLLWMSDEFSRRSKVLQTIGMFFLTCFLTWGLWYTFAVAIPILMEFFNG